MLRCPYRGCPFQGTQEAVDDHTSYMTMISDPDHRSSRYVGQNRSR